MRVCRLRRSGLHRNRWRIHRKAPALTAAMADCDSLVRAGERGPATLEMWWTTRGKHHKTPYKSVGVTPYLCRPGLQAAAFPARLLLCLGTSLASCLPAHAIPDRDRRSRNPLGTGACLCGHRAGTGVGAVLRTGARGLGGRRLRRRVLRRQPDARAGRRGQARGGRRRGERECDQLRSVYRQRRRDLHRERSRRSLRPLQRPVQRGRRRRRRLSAQIRARLSRPRG